MSETRHFAKRAAERPGSAGGQRRRGIRCEQCDRTVQRRRACSRCLDLLCEFCIATDADTCDDCRDISALPRQASLLNSNTQGLAQWTT